MALQERVLVVLKQEKSDGISLFEIYVDHELTRN